VADNRADHQTLASLHALVTGGGTGIGLASARALAADGAVVTIAGRRSDVLEAAAKVLRTAVPDAEIRTAPCDVTDEAAVAAAVDVAVDGRGHLQIAVANAGTAFGSHILITGSDAWRQALDLNVVGTFHTIKQAALAMKDAGGSIVAMSSIAAAVTHRFLAPYCASKAALEMLVRCAADELGVFGIRVNAVRPGIVPTPATETNIVAVPEVREDYLHQMPLRRLGTTDDVAAVVRFLAGPESSWITGQALGVDGGHSLRRGPDHEPMQRLYLGDQLVDSLTRAPATGAAGRARVG
jgi:NAD(P)-dependent dehydrogenase (short-subunit alcohol dehydrogenase family)